MGGRLLAGARLMGLGLATAHCATTSSSQGDLAGGSAGPAGDSRASRGEPAGEVNNMDRRRTAFFESRVDPDEVNQRAQVGPVPLDEPEILELDVPGHHRAVVSVPRGATSARPIVVATHGAGDRAQAQCHVWRATVGDRGFVLCPRGVPMGAGEPDEHTGYFYKNHIDLGREITAALDALEQRFPGYVDRSEPIYTGFSQGAIQGVPVLYTHAAGFSRAVLIEGGFGGYREWSQLAARLYKQRGGERVLFACGRPSCVDKAENAIDLLEDAGVEARVIDVEGAGHSYGGRMEEEVRRAFSWITEGDPRWEREAAPQRVSGR